MIFDWSNILNIVFVAVAGVLSLFFLIVTIAVAAKGKRKCGAFDVILRLLASLAFAASAVMLACSILTWFDGGSLFIAVENGESATATLNAFGNTVELPLAALFVILATNIGSNFVECLFLCSLAALVVDCVVANKKVKKESPAPKSAEQLRREAELDRIRRIGDSAVKKTSVVAEKTASAEAREKAEETPAETQAQEPAEEVESTPDWREEEQKPAEFVGLKNADDKDPLDDFGAFDETSDAEESTDEPAPAEEVSEGSAEEEAYESDEVLQTEEYTDEPVEEFNDEFEPSGEASQTEEYTEEFTDEPVEEPTEDLAEEYEPENAYEQIAEAEDESTEPYEYAEPRQAEQEYEQKEETDESEPADEAEEAEPTENVDELTDEEPDNIASGLDELLQELESKIADREEQNKQFGYEEPTESEAIDDNDNIEPDRDIYIPKIRTVERHAGGDEPSAKKPSGAKRTGTGTKKPSGARGGKPAQKSASAQKPKAKPKAAATPKPQDDGSDNKKLPVTRRYVILDRRNAVNMFGEYLKDRDRAAKDKLQSSINTIIIE